MIQFILAVIGLLFLSMQIDLGFWLLLPAIITIIVKIVGKLMQWSDDNEPITAPNNTVDNDKLEKDERKRKTIAAQNELALQYRTSPLTIEVLRVLCGSNSFENPPEIITIYDNYIHGESHENSAIYDFAANRVHALDNATNFGLTRDDAECIVKPQIALAQAINALLDDKYDIFDHADRGMKKHTFSDGDSYYTYSYKADHVTMVLRSTLPNKSF